MAIKTDGSAPSPALRSGSLRSPPLRAGEGAEPNANSQQQKKSTKFISGLDRNSIGCRPPGWPAITSSKKMKMGQPNFEVLTHLSQGITLGLMATPVIKTGIVIVSGVPSITPGALNLKTAR